MTVNGYVGVRGIVACAKEIGLSSEFDQNVGAASRPRLAGFSGFIAAVRLSELKFWLALVRLFDGRFEFGLARIGIDVAHDRVPRPIFSNSRSL